VGDRPGKHEALEVQMQYVRQVLHDLRDDLGKYELMKLDLKEVELGVKSIEKDIKEIKDNTLIKVQKNSDEILQLKTVGGVMSAIFSVVIALFGVFKK
jgi:hypothetical protein